MTGRTPENRAALVVEDNPLVGDMVAFMVGEYGYKVVKAVDTQEAWDLTKRKRFDLVLSDNRMRSGARAGVEFLVELAQTPDAAETRKILMSAEDPTAADLALLQRRGVEFLLKPFGFEEIGRLLA